MRWTGVPFASFASFVVRYFGVSGSATQPYCFPLNQMSRTRVRVALDDVKLFGGGHLALLARCNFDIIKIDMSLVSQISPQTPRPEWLDGLTAVLQSSELNVIAEGVETEQQLATLREAHVQLAQGFYFSSAIPAADFIRVLSPAVHSNELLYWMPMPLTTPVSTRTLMLRVSE
jgi:hypothetical protein